MRGWLRSVVVASLFGLGGLALSAQSPPAAQPPGIYRVTSGKSGEELIKLRGSMMQVQQHQNMAKVMFLGKMGNQTGELAGKADERFSDPSPTFVFYLQQNSSKQPGPPPSDPASIAQMMQQMQGAGDAPPQQAKSGDEFLLVRFNITPDGKRMVDLGQPGKTVKSKDAVDRIVERVAQGIYRLHPKAPLEPGEYGLIYGGMGGGMSAWDFGIDAKK